MAIRKDEETFVSSNKINEVHYTTWADDKIPPHAILLVAHGMAEYIDRYDDFARFMAAGGYAVFGNDHLGHGRSAAGDENLGFFSEKDGREHVVNDILTLDLLAREAYPGLPVVLLGHSMGSFLARMFCARYGDQIDAAIFMGTSGTNPAAGAGVALINIIALFQGEKHRSKFIDNMAFGGYTKGIENAQTPSDWLNTDPEAVQRYREDKWCGYLFTLSGYRELFRMLAEVSDKKWAAALPKDLPVLLVAGAEDPVGGNGKGVQEVFERLHNAGVSDLSIVLYEDMRHEILNEPGRQAVYEDLLEWCEERVKK